MRRLANGWLIGCMTLLAACSSEPETAPADWVFEGGKVFTAEPSRPWAEAVAIRGETIVYVGDAAGAERFKGEATEVIEIGNGLLLPGLIDSHTHIFNGSYADVGVNLSLADTPEKLANALVAIRDENPGSGPVYARGWQNHLFPAEGPLASQLDEVFGDRIVIMGSVDGHSTWFSSRIATSAFANFSGVSARLRFTPTSA